MEKPLNDIDYILTKIYELERKMQKLEMKIDGHFNDINKKLDEIKQAGGGNA